MVYKLRTAAAVCDKPEQYLHFLARQLSTLARLSALSNLDLQLICVSQVVGSHAESARGNLLDG